MRRENKGSKSEINGFKRHAREIVKFHLGAAPTRLEFKASGRSNFVFAASHPTGRYIIRISPDPAGLDLFIKEQWSQARAAKAGVPVAPILEASAAAIPLPYMISEALEGKEASHGADRRLILSQLGEQAALINSIKTRGFGETFDWSKNRLSHRASLAEYLAEEYRFLERVESLERRHHIEPKLGRALRKIYGELTSLKTRPHLNHGDIRLKNALVDKNDKVIAILDWEKATSHLAPHWELSLALHDLSIDEMHWLLEGYGISNKKYREFAPYIKAFNILNYCSHIDAAEKRKDGGELRRIGLRFSGALDLYSLP